jgi:predicted transcriptional regulator
MRRSASWQSVWDDRILEWLHANDGAGTPKQIHDSGLIRASKSTVVRRCQKLAEHGLLNHIGNGAYIITDEGEAYLKGEYDVEEGVYLQDMDNGGEPSVGGASSES